ncbi:MAG: 2-oxoisovalerate dehydrogenase component beta subunit [Candidatus Eremiobacteraeota bacterium]|jgi:2-oxoisovalerate dehydrogenase E1 component beta subunit|nr:2-oxoisovalerate dehydrogenase component beta subunit [Candidatus Eremiobacteraeota bacterium]
MPDRTAVRELTVIEAVREALGEEMARDDRVIVLGEDVGKLGGVFRATEGLLERFGARRVIDMPMAETVIAGVSVGLAMRGLRPVAEIQFADFIHAAMDHLVGEAAKVRWRTGGDWSCPMVLRTAYGGGFRGGPYHSQSVEAFYAHAPGLKVVAPSTPADAKGLLIAAMRDPDPVLVLEHKRTYRAIRGHVPEGDYVVPIGRAAIAREGTDATVLAYGMMLHESIAAAETLASEGIHVEVVDLRTLAPLDRETILASLTKTRRLCVVHEDTITMGLGAELCALAAEADVLDVPPVRVAMRDIPGIPVDDVLEDAVLPNRATIRDALVRLVGRERSRSHGAAHARAYDPAIPQASSIIEVVLPEEHTRVAVDALVQAATAFPSCNATFAWTGIVERPDVVVDLDLGPAAPARGLGTITLVDYGANGSDIAIPFVRPGQTAAVRIGAVRNGRAYVACAVDHRAVDGADVGRFLAAFKSAVERGGAPFDKLRPQPDNHVRVTETLRVTQNAG